MKSIYTFLFLTFFSFCTKAQNFILNFEDTTVINQVYYTDSILDPQHIWQIGVPNKPFFDSAYSRPNAVVTLLDSALPVNVNASFIIKTGTSIYTFTSLSFQQKFDFASGHGGGYVKFSVDSGITWQNLTYRNNYNSFTNGVGWTPEWNSYSGYDFDTLAGGTPYVTGNSNHFNAYSWNYSTISFPCFAEKTEQILPVWFKFTVYSDSLQASYHAGWVLDDFQFTVGYNACGGINEINSSHLKIYPDPVSDGFTLSLINTDVHDYEVSIIDLMGRVLLSKDETEKVITLGRGDIAAGSYIVQVRDKDSGDTLEKRVLFE